MVLDTVTEQGSSRGGDATVVDGAAVLAGIAAELFLDAGLMAEAKAAFEKATGLAR